MYLISTHAAIPGFNSAANDMNESGVVVGGLTAISGRATSAFVWHNTLTVLPDKGYGAEAQAINRYGLIAGAVEIMPGRLRAAVWDAAHNLILLKEPPDAFNSFTHGLDRFGHIVGGYWAPGPKQIPLFWANPAATPTVFPPTPWQWAEAHDMNDETGAWACGTDEATRTAFLWDTASVVIPIGAGDAVRVRGSGNWVLGESSGVPAQWQGAGPTPQPVPLDGLAGQYGSLSDENVHAEIVGHVSPPGLSHLLTPFLRRRMRRDEPDPSNPFSGLVLAQAETINLNDLLPPNSGWQLTTAAAINNRGQIAGTGLYQGAGRAYRLSPPRPWGWIAVRDQPSPPPLTVAQVLKIVGQVAAGGGGFGITPGGEIVPIPPEPDTYHPVDLPELLRGVLRELVESADSDEERRTIRLALEIAMDEVKSILGGS